MAGGRGGDSVSRGAPTAACLLGADATYDSAAHAHGPLGSSSSTASKSRKGAMELRQSQRFEGHDSYIPSAPRAPAPHRTTLHAPRDAAASREGRIPLLSFAKKAHVN